MRRNLTSWLTKVPSLTLFVTSVHSKILIKNRPKTFDRKYNPYSGSLWTYFAPIFRKIASQTFKSVALLWFEGRWKALSLAHRMVGQTSKSDLMRPISWVEMSWLTRNWVWNQQKSWQKNILFSQLDFFKRDEISSKKSNANVWPAVGCVRIRAFQRRSNYCCATNLWGCGASFLKTRRNVRILSKMCPQSLKKLPECGLYATSKLAIWV